MPRRARVDITFTQFFTLWISQLEEEYLPLLMKVSKENFEESSCKVVVDKLIMHHKSYYHEKWASAEKEVLPFFSPAWLSGLETASLWVTGWRPSMAFRLFDSLVEGRVPGVRISGLTEEQARGIRELRTAVRLEQNKVEREMERQQMAVADRRTLELARMANRAMKKDGNASAVEAKVRTAMHRMLAGLENVMRMADIVRMTVLKGVLGILTPRQAVEFLAAMAMVQLNLRKSGRNARPPELPGPTLS